MVVGLRIDVDTFKGTKLGVPTLCNILADHSILASFFFSVGPDNMGRHIWRLIHPGFLWKMLRTRASKLYGWDILLRGTFWPGPIIGEKLKHVIKATADAGHEVGLHAWDHYSWQTHIAKLERAAIRYSLERGVTLLQRILGHSPVCSASPAWRCNDMVLEEKAGFSFRYNSDCRGQSVFLPVVNGKELSQPQIPTTLPTYDEIIGHRGITDKNYNDYMLSLLATDRLNALTIHAEVEGMACAKMFDSFLKTARKSGICFAPLGALLENRSVTDRATITRREIPGRDGWVSCQTRRRHR